ncbi:alpha/beta fold hydrolase [Luteipulveratus mongoliensis]|uniref:Proline iminopeptidase n=1 Tax=Luteipulveratus mongoliensis TaxID=571913 RepID=A0A0K1JLX0_9MICO|nr:alpha/beta fold hydrolase [Luteipulveratus mongoliensis]AKU17701.1 proline iminopeptidase [Luteipulveratus mongoliensis]
MATRIPGLLLTDHTLTVPLDHAEPDGAQIEVFAREVVAVDKADAELPWLVFLQGGPGGAGPRPTDATGWVGRLATTHRVLLLDQRGTGRSTPLTARAIGQLPPAQQAAYIKHFRADSIVRDAEIFRHRIAGGRPWRTLGQSYGGFITLTYLSMAPEGLDGCLVTGGLPGLGATAAEIYERTFPRIATKNAQFYDRYPDDVQQIRRLADHLAEHDVRLPDGSRLSARRMRMLGRHFGMSDGFERVHWLLETAWDGGDISDRFREALLPDTSFVDGPVYALQEYCYAQGAATAWAADAEIASRPEFAAEADPLLLTGETMFRWMFEEISLLQPFAEAADLLAADTDWPPLYDRDRLASCEVPVVAALYFDDMYVDADLSLETARLLPRCRPWVTNQFEHDGLRRDTGVVGRLVDMLDGKA